MTASCILDWVEEYLAFRRGLGFELESAAWHLRDFARYAEKVGHSGPMTLDLATRWALLSRSHEPAQAARRLAVIRLFAQHRALIDPATEIPPVGLFRRVPRRKQPHIYSDAEILSLLQQTRSDATSRRIGSQNACHVLFASALDGIAVVRRVPPCL
jgi:integrase